MLTPIEIQGKVFRNSGMGYSKADVDTFFTQITSDFEELYTENIALKEKINTLTDNLNHYKEIEKSLQKALVLAETTAEETMLSAKKNASVIEQEAVLKAQSIVSDAKIDLENLKSRTSELLIQYENYKTQVKNLAQTQLDMMNSDVFNLDTSALENIETSSEASSIEVDSLQAEAVHVQAAEEAINKAQIKEVEEELDETLSSDETLIKDFTEIFEGEEKN